MIDMAGLNWRRSSKAKAGMDTARAAPSKRDCVRIKNSSLLRREKKKRFCAVNQTSAGGARARAMRARTGGRAGDRYCGWVKVVVPASDKDRLPTTATP